MLPVSVNERNKLNIKYLTGGHTVCLYVALRIQVHRLLDIGIWDIGTERLCFNETAFFINALNSLNRLAN